MNIFESKKRVQDDPHIRSMLKENEQVMRIATIHWGIYWKGLVVLLLGLYLLVVVPNLGMFIIAVALIMLVIAHLTKYYLMLVLTDRRVLIRHGIIQLDTIQIHHRRIESIEIERTIMARLLGYGRVVVSGTGTRNVIVPFIADAEQFRSDIDDVLLKPE